MNYSGFIFNVRKSFPFASLSLDLSRKPSPSELCYPVKEFALGSDKSPISRDIKNKIGQDRTADTKGSYPTLAAGSGQDNLTGDLGTALFGQITHERFIAADLQKHQPLLKTENKISSKQTAQLSHLDRTSGKQEWQIKLYRLREKRIILSARYFFCFSAHSRPTPHLSRCLVPT